MKTMVERAERWDNWNPPDGLGYSSLRPVRLTGAGRALQLGAVVMLLGGMVAGFFMDRASRRQNTEARLLADRACATTAQITRVWRTGGNGKNRNAEARNRLTYTFEHAGQRYSHSTQAPYKIWRNLQAGQNLEVRYVAERPEISHPVDWGGRPLAPWAAIPGGRAADDDRRRCFCCPCGVSICCWRRGSRRRGGSRRLRRPIRR